MRTITSTPPKILKKGRFITLMEQDGWEFVKRSNCDGIVIIVALTPERRVLLIEQYRIPVRGRVIEFPAGLVNDIPGRARREGVLAAARRELMEETGYKASRFQKMITGPSGGGSTGDALTIMRAEGLTKVGPGGGDGSEDIQVHEVPLGEVETWLRKQARRKRLIDPKIYAGLYFLKNYND